MIEKIAFWPRSSGPGELEHRPAERAQEDRRPADLERLVGEADEVALAAERLDPAQLGAAEVEELVGGRVLDGDRVEDRAGPPRRRPRAAAASPQPGGPDLAGDPDHLRADRIELALGPGLDRRRRQLGSSGACGPASAANSSLPEAPLAVRRRQDDVAQVPLERVERGRARVRAPRAAGAGPRRRPRRRLPRPARPSAIASSTGPRSGPATGRAPSRCGGGRPAGRRARRRASGRRRATAGMPSSAPRDRRQPVGERRELAGDQREEARRRAGRPRPAGSRRPRGARSRRSGTRRARRAAGRDRPARRRREPGVVEARELARPAIDEREPRRPGRRRSRPATRPSWAWIPARSRSSGWRAKYSPRNASTRAAKSVTGWPPDRGLGVESTGRDPTPPRRAVRSRRDRRRAHRTRHARGPDRPPRAAQPRPRRRDWPRSASTPRSGAGRSPGPTTEAELRAWAEAALAQPRRRHGVPVRDARRRDRPADRQQPLHEHRPRASPARDRLDLGRAAPGSGAAPTARRSC